VLIIWKVFCSETCGFDRKLSHTLWVCWWTGCEGSCCPPL